MATDMLYMLPYTYMLYMLPIHICYHIQYTVLYIHINNTNIVDKTQMY